MMTGRPSLIKNLVPGVTCRIRGYILGPSQDGWSFADDTGFVWLAGRTAKIHNIWNDDVHSLNGLVVSLIGHRAKSAKYLNTFIVEELEVRQK